MIDGNEMTPPKTFKRDSILPFGWLSLFLLLYVFLPAFILSAFLLLRVGSPALAYWVSLGALGGLALAGRKKAGSAKRFTATCVCFLMLTVFAHTISWRFFDVSHDGLAYHQHATARIAYGFNPVHDGYMYLMEPTSWRNNWSDAATYFPKLTWYFAATVYSALGDIELGKAFHLVLLFAALFFVLHQTREEHVMKRLLWVLTCLNPIAFIQLTGFLVDSALASLSIIALHYAVLHFSGRHISRYTHVMGILSLAMLFCIKHTGIAFGGIIIICICLQRLFAEYRTLKKPLLGAFASTVRLGLWIGIPLLLLVSVLGFSPYLINLHEGRHIFYPVMGASGETNVNNLNSSLHSLERIASTVYPDAHNRVTRLLTSIASYPSYIFLAGAAPAELKNPLWASRYEWIMYRNAPEFSSGGMGPLFFLLLLTSFLFCIFVRKDENAWLIFTLCLMLLIHPHSWLLRYVPFLWALPFFLCLSVPRRWGYLLAVPILLGLINSGGVAYFSLRDAAYITRSITETLAPHRGEYVLLDRSVIRVDGILNRFGITQRIANPEQTTFPNRTLFGTNLRRHIPDRLELGSSIAFAADIPPLPEQPVVFASYYSEPWVTMSEGIFMHHPDAEFSWVMLPYPLTRGFWNFSDRVKFFMQVPEKPTSAIEFALTVSLRDEEGIVSPQRVIVYADEHQVAEWVWDQPELIEKTTILPLDLLEEVHKSPLSLLVLRLDFTDAETGAARRFSTMFEKMEFRTPVFEQY